MDREEADRPRAPDGRREPGHIAIGKPYIGGDFDDGLNWEAWCPIEISGLYAAHLPPIGAGTLSALLSAIALVRTVLEAFVEGGGRILEVVLQDDTESESELDVEEVFNLVSGRPRASEH